MKKKKQKSLREIQHELFDRSALEGTTLDVIVSQYANGETYVYPLSPNYHSALSECRVAIQNPAYQSFTFFRITLPGGMVKSLNLIDKEREYGEGERIVCLCDFPTEFQTTILTIAQEKRIV